MDFIKTGKKVTKNTVAGEHEHTLKSFETREMLWHLVKRHKFFLVSTWAFVITLVHFYPPAFDSLFSLIK